MRFLTDGPNLLNELLWSRDQGRVVFFCGEGVSQAKAKLLDFLGLASDILKELKVRENASAARLLNEDAEARSGVPSAIAIDHVFGLLQCDYPVEAIKAAVAKSLILMPHWIGRAWFPVRKRVVTMSDLF